MTTIIKYKDFTGSVEISLEDQMLYGRVLHSADLVFYEGDSVAELYENFKAAVDAYIDHCKDVDKDPFRNFSGTFNCRVEKETHRKAVLIAEAQGISLNQWVSRTLEQAVNPATGRDITARYTSAESAMANIFWRNYAETKINLFPLTIEDHGSSIRGRQQRKLDIESRIPTQAHRSYETIANTAETKH